MNDEKVKCYEKDETNIPSSFPAECEVMVVF